jgi:hypothetical protein
VTPESPPAQNRLEEILERAAQGDADALERFPNVLLNGELYVLGRVEGAADRIDGNYATLADDSRLEISTVQVGDETFIAAFTSPVRLAAAVGGAERYVGLPTRVLFATRPQELKVVLNPGVWYGKELVPAEITRLLGDGFATVPPSTSVMLGLAAERPDALVEQIREWLSTRREVLSVRLGQIFDESSGVPPHPLVGLELEAGARPEDVFSALPRFDGPVDVVPLRDHPLGAWLLANGEEIHRA